MRTPIIPLYKQADKLLVKSENCLVYDSGNKCYIDFEAGDWAANLGHSNKAISEMIFQQSQKLVHDGLRFRNNESEQLSLTLLEKLRLEGGQCTFLNSGSEAVNLGITIAKNLTGRKKVLKMDCSYLSAYGHGQIHNENTGLISIPMDDTAAISDIDFNEIAAFIFEPGNAGSLIKYPENEFIEAIASEVKKHKGLLMANEVTSGFGRTGKWFGFQHYNYQPDIVAVGKALGNGYPISGVAISSKVSEIFLQKPFRYAQSHQNDALGCAIGLEVIKLIEEQDLINKAAEKGEYFKTKLIQLKSKNPNTIIELRARGLMIGLELATTEKAESAYDHLINEGFLIGCKEKTLRFMPPLTIGEQHISTLLEALDDALFAQ